MDSNLLLLISLVKNGGTLTELRRRGLRYSQIGHLVESAIENGLIIHSEGTVLLTDHGFALLESARFPGKSGTKAAWIAPADHERVDRLAPDAVYLPRKPPTLSDM